MAVNVINGKMTGTNWLIVPQDVSREYFNEFFSEKYISFEDLQNRAAKDEIIPISCLKDAYLNEIYNKIVNNGEIEKGSIDLEDFSIEYGCEYHMYKDNLESQEINLGVALNTYSFVEFIPQLLEDGFGMSELAFEDEELPFLLEDLDVQMESETLDNGDVVGKIYLGTFCDAGIFEDVVDFTYNKADDTFTFSNEYPYMDEENYDNLIDELVEYLGDELGLVQENEIEMENDEER